MCYSASVGIMYVEKKKFKTRIHTCGLYSMLNWTFLLDIELSFEAWRWNCQFTRSSTSPTLTSGPDVRGR